MVSVTKTAQVELKSGRVEAPTSASVSSSSPFLALAELRKKSEAGAGGDAERHNTKNAVMTWMKFCDYPMGTKASAFMSPMRNVNRRAASHQGRALCPFPAETLNFQLMVSEDTELIPLLN